MPIISSLKLCSFVLVAGLASISISQAETVRFNTNLGSFDVDLFEDVTPQTVANFLFYLDNGDYTNSIAHRSVPGFVIQGGFQAAVGRKPSGSSASTSSMINTYSFRPPRVGRATHVAGTARLAGPKGFGHFERTV